MIAGITLRPSKSPRPITKLLDLYLLKENNYSIVHPTNDCEINVPKPIAQTDLLIETGADLRSIESQIQGLLKPGQREACFFIIIKTRVPGNPHNPGYELVGQLRFRDAEDSKGSYTAFIPSPSIPLEEAAHFSERPDKLVTMLALRKGFELCPKDYWIKIESEAHAAA